MNNSCVNACSSDGNWRWSTASIVANCAELQKGPATGSDAFWLKYAEINADFLDWMLLVFMMDPGTEAAGDQHFHGDAQLTMKSRWLLLHEDLGMVRRACTVQHICSQCFSVKVYERFGACAGCQGQTHFKNRHLQWANTPYNHLLVVEPTEVCSPPGLKHLSQNEINYLVELPVSFHCLERQPLHCHKSQMPTFQGWMRLSGL